MAQSILATLAGINFGTISVDAMGPFPSAIAKLELAERADESHPEIATSPFRAILDGQTEHSDKGRLSDL